MFNYILFFVGFILIIFSIIVIKKDLKKSELEIEEINKIEENVKEYYRLTEEMIEMFDNRLNDKMEEINKEKINLESNYKKKEYIDKEEIEKYNVNINHSNNITEKILELQDMGLSISEIAKKLNLGIRETEIILKMYRLKNMDKNI
ncbi:MAG TPA: hypothetical protein VIK77_00450 [Tissierellaceae bacterium]